MSELSQDAKDLLGQPDPQTPAEREANLRSQMESGAVDDPNTPRPTPAVKERDPLDTPPEQIDPSAPEPRVPLKALQGERAVARKAREETERYKQALIDSGFTLDGDTIVPPTYSPGPPQGVGAGTSYPSDPSFLPQMQTPAVQALAEAINTGTVEAQHIANAGAELWALQDAAVNAPMRAAQMDQLRTQLQNEDPHAAVWSRTMDNLIREHPLLGTHPNGMRLARAIARDQHFGEILTRGGHRGKVVGRFVETPRPGPEDAEPPALTDAQAAYIKTAYSGRDDDEVRRIAERAAELRQERLDRQGRGSERARGRQSGY